MVGSLRLATQDARVNGMRISRKTSVEIRKTGEDQHQREQLGAEVEGRRAQARQAVGTADDDAASAISSVAGTRLWILPVSSAAIAPGSDATKLTGIATMARKTLNRNWSPF